MDILIIPLVAVLSLILHLYSYAILAYIILIWLEHFGVVNRYNHIVFALHTILFRSVEPLTSRIRAFLPEIGGVDLSAFVLLVFIYGIQVMLSQIVAHFPH